MRKRHEKGNIFHKWGGVEIQNKALAAGLAFAMALTALFISPGVKTQADEDPPAWAATQSYATIQAFVDAMAVIEPGYDFGTLTAAGEGRIQPAGTTTGTSGGADNAVKASSWTSTVTTLPIDGNRVSGTTASSGTAFAAANSWTTQGSEHAKSLAAGTASSLGITFEYSGLAVKLAFATAIDTVVINAGRSGSNAFLSSQIGNLIVEYSTTDSNWTALNNYTNFQASAVPWTIGGDGWTRFASALSYPSASGDRVFVFHLDTPVQVKYVRFSFQHITPVSDAVVTAAAENGPPVIIDPNNPSNIYDTTTYGGGSVYGTFRKIDQPFVNAFELYNTAVSSLSSIAGTYNKRLPGDLLSTTPVLKNGSTLGAIADTNGPLTATTHYNVNGETGEITFTETYLNSLNPGTMDVTVNFVGGDPARKYKITVINPVDATVTASANYDRVNPSTVAVALTKHSADRLTAIKLDSDAIATSAYTVSKDGNTVTFDRDYIHGLAAGVHTFTFEFLWGNVSAREFALTVSETAGGSIYPTQGRYNVKTANALATTLTLGGGATLTGITSDVGGAVTYEEDGGVVTLDAGWLAGAAAGAHVLTFNFTSGGAKTYNLAVQLPSGIDYSIWELQHPAMTNADVDQITRAELLNRDYTPYWYSGTGLFAGGAYDGYDMFQTPYAGKGTQGSNYVRAELRELLPVNNAATGAVRQKAAWSYKGYHVMETTVKVHTTNGGVYTGTDPDKPGAQQHTAIGQVWAEDQKMFELFYRGDGYFFARTSYPAANMVVDLNEGSDYNKIHGKQVPRGTEFTVKYVVSGGTLTVYLTCDAASADNYVLYTGSLNTGVNYYFKAGNYDQKSLNNGAVPDPDDIHALVGMKAIDVWHNPIKGMVRKGSLPADGVTLHYSVTGGGLAAAYTGAVTTDANGDYEIPNVPDDGTNTAAVTITVADDIDGYTKPGTDGDGVIAVAARNVGTTPITGYLVQDITYTPDTHTVTFNLNGAPGDAPTAQDVDHDDKAIVPAPAPTWADHGLVGWYTAATGGTAWDFGVDTITADTILYARWANRAALNALIAQAEDNQNDGDRTLKWTEASRNALDAALANAKTPNLAADATQDAVNAAAQALDLALYSLVAQEHTLSFFSNGGTAVPSQIQPYGGRFTEPAPAPARAGYVFKGWYENDDGFKQGEQPYTFTETVTGGLTLRANWAVSYTDADDLLAKADAILSDTDKDKKYDGTYLTALQNAYNDLNGSKSSDPYQEALADLLDIPTMIGYTVDLYVNGSSIGAQSVEYGGYVTKPQDPVVAGFDFGGWYTSANGGTDLDDEWNFDDPVAEAFDLYAMLTASAAATTYTVVYNANGGTWDDGTSANITQPGVEKNAKLFPPAVAKSGFTLTGWKDGLNATWDFDVNRVTANVTLTAQWTAVPTPVTGVTVSPAAKTLAIGDAVQLTATVAPTDATVKTVTWSSGNPAVATVSGTGLVTAVSAGTATITATTTDGGKTATCVITVSEATPAPLPEPTPTPTPTPAAGGSVYYPPQSGGTPAASASPAPSASPAASAAPQPSATPMAQAPQQHANGTATHDTLTLNGGQQIHMPMAKIADYNWVKLRDMAAILNGSNKQFSLAYDPATGTISITSGKAYSPVGDELKDILAGNFQTTASIHKIIINGKEVKLAAYYINGYNYFRLRDLAIVLNFALDYKDGAAAIDLSKGYDQ